MLFLKLPVSFADYRNLNTSRKFTLPHIISKPSHSIFTRKHKPLCIFYLFQKILHTNITNPASHYFSQESPSFASNSAREGLLSYICPFSIYVYMYLPTIYSNPSIRAASWPTASLSVPVTSILRILLQSSLPNNTTIRRSPLSFVTQCAPTGA